MKLEILNYDKIKKIKKIRSRQFDDLMISQYDLIQYHPWDDDDDVNPIRAPRADE